MLRSSTANAVIFLFLLLLAAVTTTSGKIFADGEVPDDEYDAPAHVEQAIERSASLSTSIRERSGLEEDGVKCRVCVAAIDRMWDLGADLRERCTRDRASWVRLPLARASIPNATGREKESNDQQNDDDEDDAFVVKAACEDDDLPGVGGGNVRREVVAVVVNNICADLLVTHRTATRADGFRLKPVEALTSSASVSFAHPGSEEEEDDDGGRQDGTGTAEAAAATAATGVDDDHPSDKQTIHRVCRRWLHKRHTADKIADHLFTSLRNGRERRMIVPVLRSRFCFRACNYGRRSGPSFKMNWHDEL